MDELISILFGAREVAREERAGFTLVALRTPPEREAEADAIAQVTVRRGEEVAGAFWLLPGDGGTRSIHGYLTDGRELSRFPLRPAPGADWQELLALVAQIIESGPPYPGAKVDEVLG